MESSRSSDKILPQNMIIETSRGMRLEPLETNKWW